MYDGSQRDNNPTNAAPGWDPAGDIPFSEWMLVLTAWLNLTSGRMSSTQQASAIQLAVRGIARRFALNIPPSAITYGAVINGIPTDPVTYVLYLLSNRFEQLEDERTMRYGAQVLDFQARPGERIDQILLRFDMA